MERLNWDEYFMEMADLAGKRATCLRRKVGAVIVKDNQVLATGYNGSPKGITHCADSENGCIREKLNIPSGQRHELCMAVHAEQNAIIQCAVNGNSTKGATIYVNTSPCSLCLKMIINAGITKIVTRELYPDELSKQLLKESGIEIIFLNK